MQLRNCNDVAWMEARCGGTGRQWLVLPLINNPKNDQAYLNLSVADVAVEVDAEMNACPQTGFWPMQQDN